MAYSASAITAIVTHAAAAGTALSNPIKDVVRGDPWPAGRCGRVWYGGEVPSARFPDGVLDGTIVGEVVNVTFFLPVSTTSTTVGTQNDADIETLKTELRTRIHGDSTLGNTVTDLSIEPMEAPMVNIGGAAYRLLQCEILIDFSEYPRTP